MVHHALSGTSGEEKEYTEQAKYWRYTGDKESKTKYLLKAAAHMPLHTEYTDLLCHWNY
jgi:hypothetical protein